MYNFCNFYTVNINVYVIHTNVHVLQVLNMYIVICGIAGENRPSGGRNEK